VRKARGVAALAERLDRVFGNAELATEPAQERPYIGVERLDEGSVGAEHVTLGLAVGEPLA
jgi:hypothetical protein